MRNLLLYFEVLIISTLTFFPMYSYTQDLWGLASDGGSNNGGVIFQYNAATNTYTKKFDFSNTDGHSPHGSLMRASNGKLYGLTVGGGANSEGVLFEYDKTSNTYTRKIDLSDANGNGKFPYGSLMQASNGKLYGLTNAGGDVGQVAGVLFEYDITSNTYMKKINLLQVSGIFPYGSLIQATNGKLYGLTHLGGATNEGALFEYDITTNTFSKKIDLSTAKGSYPYGSLMQASNGKLYGLTSEGGVNGGGVLFEYDITTNTYTKKVEFGGATGYQPWGSLMQASNGKLYGATRKGVSDNFGTLFEYDITSNTYTKKIDLNNTDGSQPQGALMQASNGKLYGLANSGGDNNGVGVLFEYDITSNTYTKKFSFSSAEGSYPYFTHLIEFTVPEITITGNNVTISDGDNTPSTADHTDFGSVNVGGTIVRTFTIVNSGNANLIVSTITMSGIDAGRFTVGGITLPATITASNSATFTLTLAPISGGVKTATISVNNNDTDEGTYDFAVKGTGINVYTLIVNATNGTVVKNPDQATYSEGTQVMLTATPNTGYHFVDWSSDASGSDNPLTITMDGNKTITANFAINTYTLTVDGTNGTVAKNPDQASYNHGSQVQLTATPVTGYHFTGWSGDASGSDNPLTIIMEGNKTITANFAINTYSLTVEATNGTVTKDPDQASYNHGTQVQLTATPAAGYHFTGWSGGASGSDNPLTITMDGNKTITANFAINTYTLTVDATNGTVMKDPDQASYNHGAQVQLTATPATGYHFTGWSGDASGSDNPITITIDGNKTIAANFAANSSMIVGTVTDITANEPVSNVTIDLFQGLIMLETTPTNGGGYYSFEDLPAGNYTVTVVTPLGYVADAETKQATVVNGEITNVNFQLNRIVVQSVARSVGYWKHQFNVYLTNRGKAQESSSNLTSYLGLIHQHYDPHFPLFVNVTTFSQASQVLTPNAQSPMIDKAKMQIFALLLNLVSNKIGQYTVVTADNQTAGDVLTYCSQLTTDSDPSNDETAKDLAEMVNLQQTIGANIVPSGSILYKGSGGNILWTFGIPSEYKLHEAYPNPFNPSTTIRFDIPEPSIVSLKIFNTLGQVVATLVDGQLEAGYQSVTFHAGNLPSGVYFSRMQAGRYIGARKLLLMK